ncbi:histidine kinase [Pseudonocardia ailaonensis]|uniref:histidine kinase n=1 Tax=Pseudonocardia ailaonensis TaxID=367279 RepID=A0ABN2MXW5_9PSEU
MTSAPSHPGRELVISTLLVLVGGGSGLITVLRQPGPWGAWDWVSLAIGILGFAAVYARRRARFAFGLTAVAIGAVSLFATYLPLIGVFTVARGLRRNQIVLVTVLALAVSGYTLTVRVPDVGARLTLLVGSIGMLLTSLGFGLFVGTQRRMVAGLRERAERAEAEQAERAQRVRLDERRRIAGEMHDVLGHRLSLLSVHAGALELREDLAPDTVRSTAAVLRSATHEAMRDLRKIVLVLREPVGELGGIDARRENLDAVTELVALARHAGMTVTLDRRCPDPPDPLARTAYRVVREGLTNARRHASGAHVTVTVAGAPGGELVVELVSGAGRAESPAGSGTGLIGLAERVEAVTGGTLQHGPMHGGYHLRASMPWESDA